MKTRLAILLGIAVMSAGCMSWTPGWTSKAIVSPVSAATPTTSLDQAEALFAEAGDVETLERAIAAYESLLPTHPNDPALLNRLAMTHILRAAAWADDRGEKARFYTAGIRYAERAMATNSAFAARIASGAQIGDAVQLLGQSEEEKRAMLLWVTGVSYYFKECLGPRVVFHFRWMLRAREVMERMLAVDPTFDHGAVLFSLGIYHLALPPGAGRDMNLSRDFLERAVAASGTSLLPRWGRAKYFHVKTGDRDAFVRDLEWVIAQDPRRSDSPYAWNVYFQRDAREMLARVNQWFPAPGR